MGQQRTHSGEKMTDLPGKRTEYFTWQSLTCHHIGLDAETGMSLF